MAMIKCPECGRQISDAAPVCPSCGVEIAGKVIKCPNCGEIIFAKNDFCPNCNHPINHAANATAPKAQVYNKPQQPTSQPTSQPTVTGTTAGNGGAEVPPNGAQPGKKNRKPLIISLVIVLIIAFVGYYMYQNSLKTKENDAYENAMKSSDEAVLNDYLTLYGETAPQEHVDSIQSHLDKLKSFDADWTNARMSMSKTALQDYIQKHPGSAHEMEAKQIIDSLDWADVSSSATTEAYQRYVDEHGSEGAHYDEAMQQLEKMNNMKVSAADKQIVTNVFNEYFSSLGSRDENTLLSTINSVMDNFLGKHNATKSDVMSFMSKIYKNDIKSMSFVTNNDFKITKEEVGEDEFAYSVTFSVDQHIERSDASKETFATYRVKGKVTPEGKITELSMTKIIQ
jgi:hypothetical protein